MRQAVLGGTGLFLSVKVSLLVADDLGWCGRDVGVDVDEERVRVDMFDLFEDVADTLDVFTELPVGYPGLGLAKPAVELCVGDRILVGELPAGCEPAVPFRTVVEDADGVGERASGELGGVVGDVPASVPGLDAKGSGGAKGAPTAAAMVAETVGSVVMAAPSARGPMVPGGADVASAFGAGVRLVRSR